jgi:hypothetical protein
MVVYGKRVPLRYERVGSPGLPGEARLFRYLLDSVISLLLKHPNSSRHMF